MRVLLLALLGEAREGHRAMLYRFGRASGVIEGMEHAKGIGGNRITDVDGHVVCLQCSGMER
jgi:hypothetical protein